MTIGTALSFVSLLLPVLIGVLARAAVPEGTDPAQALPYLYLEQMPTWVGALFAVSLVGAIMSVLDSMVLDATANFVRDIYQRRGGVTDQAKLVRAARLCTVVVCGIGLLLAFTIPDLNQLFVLGNGVATGGLFVVAAAAWLSRRATTTGAWWAIVGGGSATVAVAVASWVVNGDAALGFFGITPVYAAFGVAAIAIVVGSLVSRPDPTADPEATLLTNRHQYVPAERELTTTDKERNA
ncbi:MAG: hypothetical protein GEV07_27615 [Streptosporangiales bacterium]|nr:hypothetical protein [Streptosporangiales bacterium]